MDQILSDAALVPDAASASLFVIANLDPEYRFDPWIMFWSHDWQPVHELPMAHKINTDRLANDRFYATRFDGSGNVRRCAVPLRLVRDLAVPRPPHPQHLPIRVLVANTEANRLALIEARFRGHEA